MENIANYIFSTTALILMILFIRCFFRKKCNPNIQYALWIFVGLRILLPFNVPVLIENIDVTQRDIQRNLVVSYENSDNTVKNIADGAVEDNNTEITDKTLIENTILLDNNIKREQMQAFYTIKTKRVFGAIWCCGGIIMLLYFVSVNYWTFYNIKKRKVLDSQQRIPIYEVEGYNCLVGIFKPQIFVDPQILEHPIYSFFVLQHELEHYRVKDNTWLLIRNLCLVVQWFNPFVWLAYFKVQEDCELACDYRVIAGLDDDKRDEYTLTLLHLLELKHKKTHIVSPIVKGREIMERRIRSIYENRRANLYIIMLFVVGAVTALSFIKFEVKGEKIENIHTVTEEIKEEDISTLDIEKDKEYNNTIYVEDKDILNYNKSLSYEECYTTNIVRGSNHFWVDENQILWGSGTSEFGQLGFLSEDSTRITNDCKIATDVKHVDYSGEYFVIFLTNDNKLYGLGGNPAGVLNETNRKDFNSAYMNVLTEPILLMDHVVFAKCGYSSIIALLENGDVIVMGNNEYSPFNNEQYYRPRKVMDNAKYVTTYFKTYAVIDKDNSLWTWGNNDLGQCGIGSFANNVSTPQKVMNDVECVWMGNLAFNRTSTIPEQDNLIVLKKNGDYYSCGEGVGTEFLHDRTDDYDLAHINNAIKVRVSDSLVKVAIAEFKEIDLNQVKLYWSEQDLKQFLEQNRIDYYKEYTEGDNLLVYIANNNAWEFLFDEQGKISMITSTMTDEMEKDLLIVGDTLDEVIDVYGENYVKSEGEYNYYTIQYDMGSYIFQVGLYNNLGCSRFSKCIK